MYRGVVTAVTDDGVFVDVGALVPGDPFGPLPRVGAAPSVGDSVLVADCGDGLDPDLIVVGKVV